MTDQQLAFALNYDSIKNKHMCCKRLGLRSHNYDAACVKVNRSGMAAVASLVYRTHSANGKRESVTERRREFAHTQHVETNRIGMQQPIV